MATITQWFELADAAFYSRVALNGYDVSVANDSHVLLDTAMGSDNSGDHVIMDACGDIASELFPGEVAHVATHYYSEELELLSPRSVKLLCGTNILYTHMADQKQWALARKLRNNLNVCLFGVGMSDIGVDDHIDGYTRCFYQTVLSRDCLHSVRDGLTKRRLEEAGIDNVVNTACPTMWSLTPQRQAEISTTRSDTVVTSITDYCFDPVLDSLMLETLKGLYKNVVVWVQGSHDIDWCLEKIVELSEFRFIGPNIEELNKAISTEDFDYIGTRLHAGIRCLNGLHRSLIVSIDNRARQIGLDTGLPVVERRKGFEKEIAAWVESPAKTEIELPWQEINRWKAQFSS